MIILVETDEDKKQLIKNCEKSAFGCKILGIIASYGFDRSFANFWIDTAGTAVFCLIDGIFIISGTVTSEEETNAFIRAIGVKDIICAVRNAELLNLPRLDQGEVLVKQQPGELNAIPLPSVDINIRELYHLLSASGMMDEFESFYLDLSHKLRHGTAFVLEHREGIDLLGCVVISANLPQKAILSGIAVDEKHRGRGIGTSLMKATEKYLAGKQVYVFKEKGKLDSFYKNLGFKKVDTWVSAKVGA